ncbi:MAG: hypothetical protein AB7S75_07975, partial [Desulfococcaceae bacterium]
LESILSAREKLYISYVGQSLHDNTPIPPSVLVSELTDYISQGFELSSFHPLCMCPESELTDYISQGFELPEKNRDIVKEHILAQHRLQPFSLACFREDGEKADKRIFSYSEENFRIAQKMLKARDPKPAFISGRLSPAGTEWKNVALDRLCAFYKNPSKFLFRHRIGVALEEKSTVIEEKEPFDLNWLDRYRLSEKLVEKYLTGFNPKDLFSLRKAAGELPHGAVGQCRYEEICRGTEAFAKKIRSFADFAKPVYRELDLKVNGFRLTGKISNLFPQAMLRYRYADIKSWDYLTAWIHHLALNCANGADIPTVLVGTEKKRILAWEYDIPDNALEILEKLMCIYCEGLEYPVRFFPDSALAYAEIIAKGKSAEEALSQARKIWCSGYRPGEEENSYFRHCFCHCEPAETALDTSFQSLAAEVFVPLLKHRKNGSRHPKPSETV